MGVGCGTWEAALTRTGTRKVLFPGPMRKLGHVEEGIEGRRMARNLRRLRLIHMRSRRAGPRARSGC